MFYTLLTLIFLIPVASGWGYISAFFFGRKISGTAINLLSGVFLLNLIFCITAFFAPLNIFVETIAIGIGLGCFIAFKKYFNLNFLSGKWLLFSSILAVMLYFSSLYPIILDHFGYYVPTVEWLKNFGMVKGIANLDLLLGQMSFWHIFQAGFSSFTDSFLRINAVALTIYLVYIFEKKSWLHLAFLPFLMPFLSAPSPDLPAIAFSLIILNECLLSSQDFSRLFALSAYVFAIKPTMIWLPAFVFFHGIFSAKNFSFTLSGLAVLLLFFVKNCYCFGFPIFPVQQPDLAISWKPSPYLLKISSQIAIMKTYDMQFSAAQIAHFTAWDYVKNWLLLNGIKGKINIALLISMLVFAIFTWKKKQKMQTVLFFSVLAKVVLVLVFSAQYRFFLDVFFVVAAVLFLGKNPLKFSVSFFTVFAIIFTIFFSVPGVVKKFFPSFHLAGNIRGYNPSQFYKPGVYSLKNYQSFRLGNLDFNVVKNYPFSFDTPIPAISPEFLREDFAAGIFPQKISNKLSDGFIWKKLSAEEKMQLAAIIHKVEK